MCKKDIPNMNIGPEPSTEKFTAVCWGHEEGDIPGQSLTLFPYLPFKSLANFGGDFLSRFEGVLLNSDILKHIILVDTPGMQSSGISTAGRLYDYNKVVDWFADKSDLILFMLDPFKLDISEEMENCIKSMSYSHHQKLRFLLNKCDSLSLQDMLRVHGALMYNLGKMINNPEVPKIYVGSFWDEKLKNKDLYSELFSQNINKLSDELYGLDASTALSKINKLIKRCVILRAHTVIVD